MDFVCQSVHRHSNEEFHLRDAQQQGKVLYVQASEQFCLFFCFQQNMQKWFEKFWFCCISVLFFVHLRVCLFVYLLLSLFSKKREHPAVRGRGLEPL